MKPFDMGFNPSKASIEWPSDVGFGHRLCSRNVNNGIHNNTLQLHSTRIAPAFITIYSKTATSLFHNYHDLYWTHVSELAFGETLLHSSQIFPTTHLFHLLNIRENHCDINSNYWEFGSFLVNYCHRKPNHLNG